MSGTHKQEKNYSNNKSQISSAQINVSRSGIVRANAGKYQLIYTTVTAVNKSLN